MVKITDKIFEEYSNSLLKCENYISTLTSKHYYYNKMRILHDVIENLYGLNLISSYRYNIWFIMYSDRELNIIKQVFQNEEGH